MPMTSKAFIFYLLDYISFPGISKCSDEENIGLQFLASGLSKSGAFHENLILVLSHQIGLAVSLVERGKVCAHFDQT